MHRHRIRAVFTTMVVVGAIGWGFSIPSSADDVPEACGFVAVKAPNAWVDTTIVVPTTAMGQTLCTTRPCAGQEAGTGSPATVDTASADVMICVKGL
jgi:hypothetical protein